MKNKKILYIILLVVLIVAIGIFVFFTVNRTEKLDVSKSNNNTSIGTRETDEKNETEEQTNIKETKPVTVTTLDDGTLYSVTNDDFKTDIIIGDNYFDTQMADINMNFSKYEGKTVEIEGMSLTNDPFTFVGRYSTSNICPDCPTGYSYFEYEWKGDKTPELQEEETWLKVRGTFKKGDDNGMEYYYIDVANMEVMNEKGLETVNN